MMLTTLLAILGMLISLLARRKQTTSNIEDNCDSANCDTVLRTPQAALFAGLPNTVLGIAWYSALLLWSAAGILISLPHWLDTIMILCAAVAAGVSVYLAGSLLFVLRQSCPLCYAAHAVNAAVLAAVIM